MKLFKKIFISVLILLTVALGFVGNYFYNFALNPAVDKSKVVNQDSDGSKSKTFEEDQKWFEDNKKEISLTSVTKNKLTGYVFENKNSSKWIFVVHGYTSSAKKMATYIHEFYSRGYNVFAPDLIAHGKSEGNFISMGSFDAKDLANWTSEISKTYNSPDILFYGISMGGATVMNSLNEKLPNNVKAFIEDSGYVNLDEEFTYQLKKLFNLPKYPVIPAASIVTKIRAGYFLGDVNVEGALEKNTLPALILHGDNDGFVPLSHAERAYSLLKSKKDIHIFKGARHAEAERKYKKEFWDTVDKFLEENFKK